MVFDKGLCVQLGVVNENNDIQCSLYGEITRSGKLYPKRAQNRAESSYGDQNCQPHDFREEAME